MMTAMFKCEYFEDEGKFKVTNGHFVLDLIDEITEYFRSMPESSEPHKVGMIGTEYAQFGWSKLPEFEKEFTYDKKEFTNFSYGDCCVWWFPMLYKEKGIMYDNLPLKCDRDLTAQVLASGLYCRKVQKWQMDSPLNGKANGGCQLWYKMEGQEHSEVCSLLHKWNGKDWDFPEGFTVDPKTGRPVFEDPEVEKAYLKQEKAPNLANFKPKKTSYGRASDIKFWWQRIYSASQNRMKDFPNFKKPENIKGFDDSINNFKLASELK